MNTLFRSTIAVAVLVSARTAHADCLITGLKPDEAMLLTMGVGQEFSFVATDDCVELRFHVQDPKLTKIPKAGRVGSDREATYKVVLTEREWNLVSDGEVELTWSIIGTPRRGKPTVATQTNTIDHDLHFKLGLWDADAKITGEAPSDEAGASVSSAGDVNGDGNDDVLIGAPGKWGHRGGAYLITGPVPEVLDLSTTAATFVGEARRDEAGASVSYVDDMNDDSYDELLIGAPGNGGNVGAAYLMYGPVTGPRTPGDADVKLVGEGPGEDWAGFSVSGTGDIDGDDRGDLLIGSFWQSDQPRTGAAYLVMAASVTDSTFELADADAKLLGPTRDDQGLGVNVARAGDVDGDGGDDLAVGVDWNDEFGVAGKSFAVSDPRSMEPSMDMDDMSQPGIVMFNPESGADAASALSGAGDVDNDGYDDLLIGASDNITGGQRAGSAYLILGRFRGTKSHTVELAEADAKFVGEDPGDRAGSQVSSAGDVDGDDYDDILISACRNNDGAGAAYLVLGPITGTMALSRADVKLMGEEADDCAGFGVSSAGDVDGDELDDVLVGAPGNSDGAGAVYLLGGATLSSLMDTSSSTGGSR